MIYWQGAVDICQVNLNILVHSNMVLGRGHILHADHTLFPHFTHRNTAVQNLRTVSNRTTAVQNLRTVSTELLHNKTSGLFQTELL